MDQDSVESLDKLPGFEFQEGISLLNKRQRTYKMFILKTKQIPINNLPVCVVNIIKVMPTPNTRRCSSPL